MRITRANQLSEQHSHHFLAVQVLVGQSRRALGVCGLRLTVSRLQRMALKQCGQGRLLVPHLRPGLDERFNHGHTANQ